MKRINLKRIAAAVIVVSSVFVGVYGSTVPSAAEPDEYHDDWLHVNENAENSRYVRKSGMAYRVQLVRIQCRQSGF